MVAAAAALIALASTKTMIDDSAALLKPVIRRVRLGSAPMQLATFLAPGGDRARRPARSAATRSSRSRPARVLDRLASGDRTPADGATYRARRRHAARAGPAPARDLLHRPQLRRAHRRARLRAARRSRSSSSSCRSRASRPRGPVTRPTVVTRSSTTRPSSRSSSAPDNTIAGYAVADDVSARDLQRARGAVDARQGLRHLVPVGPVDHDRRRAPGRRRPADHDPRQRRAAPGRAAPPT